MSDDGMSMTRDYVDYQPVPVKVLSQVEFETAAKYSVIISALRENILTVKEIHDLYLTETDEGKTHSVTQQTIYRYLEEMEKAGLVVVAGYRKTEGVKSSERIYGRTAKTFMTIPPTEVQEISDPVQRTFFYNLAKIIAIALDLNISNLDLDSFISFYEQYMSKRALSVKRLYEKGKTNEELSEIFTSMSLEQVNEAMWYIQLFVPFIQNPDLLQKLKSLYE